MAALRVSEPKLSLVSSVRRQLIEVMSTCGMANSELATSPSFSKSRKMTSKLELAWYCRGPGWLSLSYWMRDQLCMEPMEKTVIGASEVAVPVSVLGASSLNICCSRLEVEVTSCDTVSLEEPSDETATDMTPRSACRWMDDRPSTVISSGAIV